MVDYRFIRLIEKFGCINKHGERVYGTAALLHVLHCPVAVLKPEYIKRGEAYVKNSLSIPNITHPPVF